MALFKCDACHHFQETSNDYIGKNARCPKCKENGTIFNTLSYIKEITENNISLKKKLLEIDKIKEIGTSETNDDMIKVYDPIPIDDFDIHNTDIFSQKDHYAPIIKWFKEKYIQANVNPKMMDTTGLTRYHPSSVVMHTSIQTKNKLQILI